MMKRSREYGFVYVRSIQGKPLISVTALHLIWEIAYEGTGLQDSKLSLRDTNEQCGIQYKMCLKLRL